MCGAPLQQLDRRGAVLGRYLGQFGFDGSDRLGLSRGLARLARGQAVPPQTCRQRQRRQIGQQAQRQAQPDHVVQPSFLAIRLHR